MKSLIARLHKVCSLVGVIVFVLACSAIADDNEVPINSFGNWRIIYVKTNNTYILRASTNGGYIDLQCHPKQDRFTVYTVSIPLWNLVGKKGEVEKVKTITIWTDKSPRPVDITLPLYKGVVMVGMTNVDWTRDAVLLIVEVMGSARQFFAYSYDGVTLQFDTTHMSVARVRFAELCARL